MKPVGSMILLLSLAALASAFVPADDDYLCDSPQELSFYNFSRWFSYELPIKVHIPAMPYKIPQPGLYSATVQKAFQSWSAAVPELRFQFVKDPKQAQILVKWVELLPDSESVWGASMFPQASFNAQRRLVHHSVLHMPIKDQQQPAVAPDEINREDIQPQPVFFTGEDLLALALHQVGHALGLPHSKDLDDIMSTHLFARVAANNHGTLSKRDAATLRRLYTLPVRMQGSPCNGD
ncbi:MAG: matrixin family metalloprotease [Candidatus Sericytochromatia bacterium]